MRHGEAYDLWLRMLDKGYKIHNLPKYLIKYRYHQEGGKYTAFKRITKDTYKLQIKALIKYKNIGFNILLPLYLLAELFLLLIPAKLGYYLFEKIAFKLKAYYKSA